MVAPYRLVQRIFRSLVRVQPDAAVIVLYIVDTIAFGVIWWRLAEWPSKAAEVDRTTVDLLGGSAFAAGVALLIGLWLSVYLDRETDRSEDIRVLALRTRHDHRLARLQGLDPMDRATRWALWLARQSADSRVILGEPAASPAEVLDDDRPAAPAAFDEVRPPMVAVAPMPPPVIAVPLPTCRTRLPNRHCSIRRHRSNRRRRSPRRTPSLVAEPSRTRPTRSTTPPRRTRRGDGHGSPGRCPRTASRTRRRSPPRPGSASACSSDRSARRRRR